MGTNAFDHIHPDDVGRVKQVLARLERDPGVHLSVEYRVRDRDSRWRCFEAIGANLLGNTAVEGIVVATRDVTERKRAEEEAKTRARQQSVVADLGRWALIEPKPPLAHGRGGRPRRPSPGRRLLRGSRATSPEDDELLLRVGRGWHEGLVGRATAGARRGSLVGYALRTDGPVIIEDLHTETRFGGCEPGAGTLVRFWGPAGHLLQARSNSAEGNGP